MPGSKCYLWRLAVWDVWCWGHSKEYDCYRPPAADICKQFALRLTGDLNILFSDQFRLFTSSHVGRGPAVREEAAIFVSQLRIFIDQQ